MSCCYGDEKACRWKGSPLRDMPLPIYSIAFQQTRVFLLREQMECIAACFAVVSEYTRCLYTNGYGHSQACATGTGTNLDPNRH